MMSKYFDNYVKGQEFHEIFEAFGDGIFNTDSEKWKNGIFYRHIVPKSVWKLQKWLQIGEEKKNDQSMQSI
jgi:hypothetical protein